MPNYTTPGVYIEEIPKLPASVVPVSTAIPAFIGYTEKAEKSGKALVNVPTRIISMAEYEAWFGGPNAGIELNADGTLNSHKDHFLMFNSMQMYFANGGGPCYIVSCGLYLGNATIKKNDLVGATGVSGALATLVAEDEPTLIVFPDAIKISDAVNYYGVMNAALDHCKKMGDRFTIMDVYTSPDEFRTKIQKGNRSYGAAYYPLVISAIPFGDRDAKFTGGAQLNTFSVANRVEAAKNTTAVADALNTLSGDNTVLGQARKTIAGIKKIMPMAPIMAGIYARVDRDRGVWKAPANETVKMIVEPTVLLTTEDQDSLNVHPSGKSINAIRRFRGSGNLVWGARTLDGNSGEWKYIPVRRLFLMVEESILKATEPFVFEPNDANTWNRVKAMAENFLTTLWRDGALAGATPKEAFFVNVGLGSTMTAQEIIDGYLNIEIGLAAVRPAEFVILRFSHKLQES